MLHAEYETEKLLQYRNLEFARIYSRPQLRDVIRVERRLRIRERPLVASVLSWRPRVVARRLRHRASR